MYASSASVIGRPEKVAPGSRGLNDGPRVWLWEGCWERGFQHTLESTWVCGSVGCHPARNCARSGRFKGWKRSRAPIWCASNPCTTYRVVVELVPLLGRECTTNILKNEYRQSLLLAEAYLALAFHSKDGSVYRQGLSVRKTGDSLRETNLVNLLVLSPQLARKEKLVQTSSKEPLPAEILKFSKTVAHALLLAHALLSTRTGTSKTNTYAKDRKEYFY